MAPGAGAPRPSASLRPGRPLEVWPPSGLHRGGTESPGPAAGVHFMGGAAAGLAGPEASWTPREALGRRSPVSAPGPRVSGREPGARGQRSGRAAAADAELAEQPASVRRWSVPPHQAQLQGGSGEGGVTVAHLGLGNRSRLPRLPSPVSANPSSVLTLPDRDEILVRHQAPGSEPDVQSQGPAPRGCSLGLLLLLQPSVCWDNSTASR